MQVLEERNYKKTIAIIGGGICGIASAKTAIDYGFVPTIFEKRKEVGGVWAETGYTWNSLIGNSSRYMGQFNDLEFPQGSQTFSKRTEIISYMKTYIDKFGLAMHIKLGYQVNKIVYIEEKPAKWRVEWLAIETNEVSSADFDNLIVATGFYNEPNMDHFENFIRDPSNNQIKFLHSKDYKTNDEFKDKKVLLVGCSYSSTQIASEIAKVSKNLVNVFRRPSWILPRTVYNSYYQKMLPIDFTFFTLGSVLKEADKVPLSPEEKNMKLNQFFAKCTKQNQSSPELFIDENSTNPPNLSISDDYVDAVDLKQLLPMKGEIASIKNNVVVLKNGFELTPDIILFSTGFKHLLPNIDEKVLKALQYDQNNQLSPLNLYNSTFNPLYNNLAFVGVYKGLFLGTAEIQAKYALEYLTNGTKIPLVEIEEHLKKDLEQRKYKIQPQYANGGYVVFLNKMAKEMNMMPDVNKIRETDLEVYNIMMNCVACPSVYFLNSEKEEQQKKARESLLNLKEQFKLESIPCCTN